MAGEIANDAGGDLYVAAGSVVLPTITGKHRCHDTQQVVAHLIRVTRAERELGASMDVLNGY